MDLSLLLDMAASGFGDRVVLGRRDEGLTASQLHARATAGAGLVTGSGAAAVVYVGRNGPAFATALFAAAKAGVPLIPLNYRLSPDRLRGMVEANQPALVIAEEPMIGILGLNEAMSPDDWLGRIAAPAGEVGAAGPGDVAVLLYTSGTTAAPKAAVLRHQHLTSYVLSTVEFGGSAATDASLVSVPPYHIAGVSNTITNLYSGRRIVHLPDFTPQDWLDTVQREQISHALVVPTMLARLVEHLDGTAAAVPSLRAIAYGGAPMPAPVIEAALAAFDGVDFVNAYGLTETSSTIALLGPDDHRAAVTSPDPHVRARLRSAGKIVPGIEAQIRGEDGTPQPAGQPGLLWVRGPQVSGEYRGSAPSNDGWFCTRDEAYLDNDGYLFILGRADDTIIRGGENIAPAEIEEVLRTHPAVTDAAVTGIPDDEWGQRIAAAVIARPQVTTQELREHVRAALRGSKTPDTIVFVNSLPYSDLGKLSRRAIAQLIEQTSHTV